MLSVVDLDAPELTDGLWQRYFDFLAMMRDRHQAQLHATTWQELKTRIQAFKRSGESFDDLLFMRNGEIVGWLNLMVRRSDQQGVMAFASFDTLFESIPVDYAAFTAAEMMRLLERRERTSARCMTTNSRASNLAAAWGARRQSRVDRYRLMRAKANITLMEQWLRAFPERFPRYRICFFETVPDEYVDRYIDLMRQFIADMPKEHEDDEPFVLDRENLRRMEEARQAAGAHLYTVALLDEAGVMIGHSNASIFGRRPRDVYQSMTGIDPAHRGRGLSRWLKAALFKKVGEDFPTLESLTTDMRAVNEPIQKVNAQIGYELLSQGHEYRIEVDALRAVAGHSS
jgi:RimJ/RimL family protein N-acetyltransferase